MRLGPHPGPGPFSAKGYLVWSQNFAVSKKKKKIAVMTLFCMSAFLLVFLEDEKVELERRGISYMFICYKSQWILSRSSLEGTN